jgi:hypothetical protein
MVNVKERLYQDVKSKFDSLNTDLTKMEYLESVLKTDATMDVKKFAYLTLTELYEKKLMFDKAAKVISAKAGYDSTFREKIDSYLRAGELFAKSGNIVLADDMFVRASREGNSEQQAKTSIARKNIFLTVASDLEKRGRMSHAVKFYEHLLSLKLDELEKSLIKKKLVDYYKRVGRFNDARIVETR